MYRAYVVPIRALIHERCHFCLASLYKRSRVMRRAVCDWIACKNCAYSVYCSERCSKEAWKRGHAIECGHPIFSALPTETLLAHRMLISNFLRQQRGDRTILDLNSHIDRAPTEVLVRLGFQAVLLDWYVKTFLGSTTSCKDEAKGPSRTMQFVEKFKEMVTAERILILLFQIRYNGVSVNTNDETGLGDMSEVNHLKLGLGLYTYFSMVLTNQPITPSTFPTITPNPNPVYQPSNG
mmetsp:Transcript_30638/g.49126  ORF Transcript_30638/g.49126 Transcript_30638/m.49126 type:complete len:237 (-) Transcript_30638:1004-1714(-)